MTTEKRPQFTVIENKELVNNISPKENSSYHTNPMENPMYEKLMKFRELQQRKRFTVEDLLR